MHREVPGNPRAGSRYAHTRATPACAGASAALSRSTECRPYGTRHRRPPGDKTAGLPKGMRTTTKATTFAKIRCFLRAAFRRGWIKEALVDKVTTVKAVYNQKEPYTDEEVRVILDHAQELDGGT